MKNLRRLKVLLIVVLLAAAAFFIIKFLRERQVLLEVIERLSADSRVAEVLVTEVKPDSKTNKTLTTIKFLEYDTNSNPLDTGK